MWLAERKRAGKTDGAMTGYTTLESEAAGVYLDGERREVSVFTPGGYCWRPMLGQELLVVKGPDGPCAVGGRRSGEVGPGEVLIFAAKGGAAIRLKNDGSLELTGRVTVNGKPIEELGGGNGTGA